MLKIKTVGVVGAGTMGAALAQKFAQEGFAVVLCDRATSFVEKGIGSIERSLREGVERKIFSPENAAEIIQRITGTEQLEELATCELVVEAIFEDFSAKSDLFRRLAAVIPAETIVATNTSSFAVGDLARTITHPERFIGLHYFYHAAKNRLVEIIPGAQTSPETVGAAERFCFATGKDAIHCRDRNGFAVNRFFVPWLNEAARLLEEKIASMAVIDRVCCDVFGIGMGPFALMNATGVPIAYHSQCTLEALGSFYAPSEILKTQATKNLPWVIQENSEENISDDVAKNIRERMLAAVFLVSGQILDDQVCTATALDRGARIGLKWAAGPTAMMRVRGREEVERLVRLATTRYQAPFPCGIKNAFEPPEFVSSTRKGSTTIVRIERPEDLNALNEIVVDQLGACMRAAEKDPACKTIVLTGSGKAFVAGADIGFFVDNIRGNTIDHIVSFTAHAQEIFDRVDRSAKKVVALLNGMTLGGGLELALCADVIVALPNVRVAFPETGIGIYPGLGGTQRTQRRIGRGLTKYLIYTGDMIAAADAQSMGLIDRVLDNETMFSILDGNSIPEIPREAPDEKWKPIGEFFDRYSVETIIADDPSLRDAGIDPAKWRKRILQKAPVALRTAEQLVNEARGCASELESLQHIFHTSDALLGLTNIGKKVVFHGE